jgi:AMP-binding enzyme
LLFFEVALSVTPSPERLVVNIADPILAQCRFQPDAPALCVPGEQHATIAYGQLGKLINNVARHAEWVGLRRGDTVVLYVADQIAGAVLILGLAKAGVVTISGHGPELPPGIKVDAILSDFDRGLPSGTRIIPVGASWMAATAPRSIRDCR